MKKTPAGFSRFAFAGISFFFLVFSAYAETGIGEFPELVSRAAVVMDAETGTVIYQKNPDEKIQPASLTKLMGMHLAFKEIDAGRTSPDAIIRPPSESWGINQPRGSSLAGLADGQQLTLREILLGKAIFSGNDTSTALALHLAPSIAEFVKIMNLEAAAMGLTETTFVDVSGYSDQNWTTAREFAEFSRLYLDAHPESLGEYHSVIEFSYPKSENVAEPFKENPGTRTQRNRNALLGRVEGVDGLKTGSIPASGFNIALTAARGGTRFIAVILGAPSGQGGDRIRDEDGRRLLEWAFANYKTIRIEPEIPDPVRVWKGSRDYTGIAWGGSLAFTASSKRGGGDIAWNVEPASPLIAPLKAGSFAGDLVVYDPLGELHRIPLFTAGDVEAGGFFKRIFDSIRLFFRRR